MPQTKVKVIPAELSHIPYLAKHMREVDKKEIWANSCLLPRDSLTRAVETCPIAQTVINIETGNPIMMFGIGQKACIMSRAQPIWMLATNEIYNIPFKFLRECSQYIDLMGSGAIVYNYVIEGNNRTLKWLHWLGFTILKAKPHGMLGKNFHYIEKDLGVCANQPQ